MDPAKRPSPSERIHDGEPTRPRPAATVILVRGASERLEVLLVQRNPSARFMGGAWVFPGGAVDAGEAGGESEDDAGLRRCAMRELREEAAVTLERPDDLVAFARWITPARVRTRFDALFFLAAAPDGADPHVDGAECVDLRWYAPEQALTEHADGQLELVFPTIKTLEQLARFASADELLAFARRHDVVAVEPRVVGSGATAQILMPGDPGYDP